jgi:hypothetical protein
MDVLASECSINQHGEGRIAKTLTCHLIDAKQFDKIEKLSKQRGAQLSTVHAT